ncbi:MAG: diadenylate cyclase [Bacteroidales bacterium]|nr:diadenylate cyclase [Bacteroidales bacterium]
MFTLLAISPIIKISLIDIIDIVVVAMLIFLVVRQLKNSTAANILMAIISIYIIKGVVDLLNMKMTAAIIQAFIDVGIIALIIIFQPEIRRFLNNLGARYQNASRNNTIMARLFRRQGEDIGSGAVSELIEACRDMSADKTGALIVIPGQNSLQDIIATGDVVDAKVNSRLIRNIFFKNSPLHDGAMILSGERIIAARCTLPMTSKEDLPPSFGMRHKAAIGISEASDAQVILISEESGHIAYCKGGEITIINNINELRPLISTK